MDIAATLKALETIATTDAPTTAKAARELAGTVADVLSPLREFVTELDSLLTDAEAGGTLLSDADADDREDEHTNLVNAVDALREHLMPDQVLAPAG